MGISCVGFGSLLDKALPQTKFSASSSWSACLVKPVCCKVCDTFPELNDLMLITATLQQNRVSFVVSSERKGRTSIAFRLLAPYSVIITQIHSCIHTSQAVQVRQINSLSGGS